MCLAFQAVKDVRSCSIEKGCTQVCLAFQVVKDLRSCSATHCAVCEATLRG